MRLAQDPTHHPPAIRITRGGISAAPGLAEEPLHVRPYTYDGPGIQGLRPPHIPGKNAKAPQGRPPESFRGAWDPKMSSRFRVQFACRTRSYRR